MVDARQAILDNGNPTGGGAMTAVRFAFRALSTVAPAVGARLAGRIWFKPPHAPLTEKAKALLATGTRFDLTVNGRNVAAWRWGESGPAVLLMHGWGGNAAQMASFAEPLVRAGYRAIAFDAPGHGASAGSRLGARRSSFFDFADALVEVSRRAGDVAAVIAHSGGCTATASAIRRNGWRVPAAVFIAPMGSPLAYRTIFQQALGFSDDVMRRFAANTEQLLQFQWHELEVPEVARIAETPRLLVIHDREDPETSWREGATIAETWPNATLRTVNGLGHRRVLRDAETIAAAVDFITLRG